MWAFVAESTSVVVACVGRSSGGLNAARAPSVSDSRATSEYFDVRALCGR